MVIPFTSLFYCTYLWLLRKYLVENHSTTTLKYHSTIILVRKSMQKLAKLVYISRIFRNLYPSLFSIEHRFISQQIIEQIAGHIHMPYNKKKKSLRSIIPSQHLMIAELTWHWLFAKVVSKQTGHSTSFSAYDLGKTHNRKTVQGRANYAYRVPEQSL